MKKFLIDGYQNFSSVKDELEKVLERLNEIRETFNKNVVLTTWYKNYIESKSNYENSLQVLHGQGFDMKGFDMKGVDILFQKSQQKNRA